MAEYSKLVITENGQALMAKMIAGTGNIEFTKVCASSTTYTESQLEALTALTNIKQTVLVSKVTRTNEVAIKIEAAFSNAELTTGYYMRTLGLYAVDPDAGEILYAVTIETSGNCYMPPYNSVTVSAVYIQLYTTVGNADSVSLEVDSGAYATIGDIQALEEEIADLKEFVGYTDDDDDIYGVEVDFTNKTVTRLAGAVNRSAGSGFDDIHAFGGRKRCNVTDDGVVVAYYGDAAYTTTGKLTQAVTVDDTTYASGAIVQTMVEQPKFYYRVVPLDLDIINAGENQGHHMRKARYYVSDTPKTGFKLHPAFTADGENSDFVYLAAFEGSLYDYSASAYILNDSQVASFTAAVGAGDMLSSIANAIPMSGLTQNLTRANTRILAENRGDGWEQATIQTISASQLLMLIEYATFNMQTAIGRGAVDKTDDGSTNMSEATGATVNLGNASGYVTNDNDVMFVSYRGEENLWGNIWAWIDGVNAHNPSDWTSTSGSTGEHGNLYVADHDFADNTGDSPYEDTGICPVYSAGSYINAFGYSEDYDWLFIPTEIGGNSSLPIGDYFYNYNADWRVARLGGRWINGLDAGGFCWNLYDASSSRSRFIGGRLVYRKKAA